MVSLGLSSTILLLSKLEFSLCEQKKEKYHLHCCSFVVIIIILFCARSVGGMLYTKIGQYHGDSLVTNKEWFLFLEKSYCFSFIFANFYNLIASRTYLGSVL